jgi:hypothetical protein
MVAVDIPAHSPVLIAISSWLRAGMALVEEPKLADNSSRMWQISPAR